MASINVFLKNIIWAFKNLIYQILSIIPVNKKIVVFESYLGQSFSGSPKYIYLKLKEIDELKKFKCIWVFENPSDFKSIEDINTIVVKNNSIKHYYYLSRAKFWIRNSESMSVLKKRPSTIYIQTWHGTPLKKMFYDINLADKSKVFMYKLKHSFRNWTHFIAPNEHTEQVFKNFFDHNIEIIRLGYPRNDLLVNESEEYKNRIKDKLGIEHDKKIILYTPTFRDYEYNNDISKFEFKLNFNLINKELADYIIIVRAHYYISKLANLSYFENVYNFSSDRYDIQELYSIADMLITDYSSVMFDYAYTKKPILFYVYDYEKYNETRGSYFNLKENPPGPLLYSTSEIIENIKNIELVYNQYSYNYKKFYNKFCKYSIGNSSENIVKIILDESK